MKVKFCAMFIEFYAKREIHNSAFAIPRSGVRSPHLHHLFSILYCIFFVFSSLTSDTILARFTFSRLLTASLGYCLRAHSDEHFGYHYDQSYGEIETEHPG